MRCASIGNSFEALDQADRANWASLSTLAGECGGCGTEPTRTGLEDFAKQWLDQSGYRATLLGADLDAAGLVLRADGKGRKTALLVLGTRR